MTWTCPPAEPPQPRSSILGGEPERHEIRVGRTLAP